MIDFLKQLPHLEAYGNPFYFIYLGLALLPIFVGLFFKKRFAIYECLVSLAFIVLALTGTHASQLLALLFYIVWQIIWVYSYKHYRSKKDNKWVFYLHSFLVVLPLIFVKVEPAINGTQSLLNFLGISYLTFRSVGMIIEMRDGVLKEFTLGEFLRFMLFMPTFTSGPIDRFKRFNEDYKAIPERDELMNMLEQAVKYIMLGFLYKFVFGLDLFFDFAGYSMFALAASNLMGIKSPINFDKPFISRDLKEFWNRWHMSLSFWFRDFVFMRLVMVLMRNKVFKNRNTTSNVAYVINMMVMGFWHGVTWYYIAYGIFHGIGLGINDAWLRKKKTINKERKKAGLEPLPENKWTKALGIFITFNTVMLSFLIFSGFLNDLWFTKK